MSASLGYLGAIDTDTGILAPGNASEWAFALAGAGYALWRWRSPVAALALGWGAAKFTFPVALGVAAYEMVKRTSPGFPARAR